MILSLNHRRSHLYNIRAAYLERNRDIHWMRTCHRHRTQLFSSQIHGNCRLCIRPTETEPQGCAPHEFSRHSERVKYPHLEVIVKVVVLRGYSYLPVSHPCLAHSSGMFKSSKRVVKDCSLSSSSTISLKSAISETSVHDDIKKVRHRQSFPSHLN